MFNLHTAGRWMAVAVLGMSAFAGGCNQELKQENEALRQQATELQRELDAEREARKAADEERMQLAQRLGELEDQVTQPAAGTAGANTGFEAISEVEVERGSRGEITVRVPGDVLFASGKSSLRESAKKTLSDIAGVLKRKYSGQTIRVEGYTDADPIRKSKWKDNLELSAQRAMAVHRYLQEQGIAPERMYAAGFGATNFRATNNTAAGKAQNRRVEIVVVMN